MTDFIIKQLSRLDRINKELEELQKPETIERLTADIYGDRWAQNLKKKVAADIDSILKEVTT